MIEPDFVLTEEWAKATVEAELAQPEPPLKLATIAATYLKVVEQRNEARRNFSSILRDLSAQVAFHGTSYLVHPEVADRIEKLHNAITDQRCAIGREARRRMDAAPNRDVADAMHSLDTWIANNAAIGLGALQAPTQNDGDEKSE